MENPSLITITLAWVEAVLVRVRVHVCLVHSVGRPAGVADDGGWPRRGHSQPPQPLLRWLRLPYNPIRTTLLLCVYGLLSCGLGWIFVTRDPDCILRLFVAKPKPSI